MTIDMTFERREELIRRDERAEGIAEGITKGKTEIIRGALKKGSTPELIADVNGIPLEEVQKIQAEMLETV